MVRADIVRDPPEPILRLDLPGHTGEVMALAFSPDSRRLFSAGRDKVGFAWRLDEAPAALRGRNVVRRRAAKEFAIRWQVGRGPRGEIDAMAACPSVGDAPPLVAIAGYGLLKDAGEIVLVDARDGSWVKTLGGATLEQGRREGHGDTVVCLQFTPDGGWLVSQDLLGGVFAWKRSDDWRPLKISDSYVAQLGKDDAAKLIHRREDMLPLAVLGNGRVARPVLSSSLEAVPLVWQVEVVDLANAGARRRLPYGHTGTILAMASTADGGRVVSSDLAPRVVIQDSLGQQPARNITLKQGAESLGILPDASRIVVGIARSEDGAEPPALEVWDIVAGRRMSTRQVSDPVRAIAVSPDGSRVAWTGGEGHAVTVETAATLSDAEEAVPAAQRQQLGGIGQQITRVAFSSKAADAKLLERDGQPGLDGVRGRNIVRQRPAAAAGTPPRRIAVSREPRKRDAVPAFDAAFDLDTLAVEQPGDAAAWSAAEGRPAGWSISLAATQAVQNRQRLQLAHAGKPAGAIILDKEWQEAAAANGLPVTWLTAEAAASPWAVAVGTDVGIFVYRLEEVAGRECQLVRWFRGNESAVLSLAVSEDGNWLASGNGDGTTMLWSLFGVGRDSPLTDRWGVKLEAENGTALVGDVAEAGPLLGKQVQKGDVIRRISWYVSSDQASQRQFDDGAEIIKNLAEMPWNTQVLFTVERAGNRRQFYRYPAWENLATIHLAQDAEWAYWTPRGYYAASANGDRFFGWLVNRGIDAVPRFFVANQFRRRLERPDVMSRLLTAGGLDAALRSTGCAVPKSTSEVLPEETRRAPEIQLISPTATEVAGAGRLTIRADVVIPDGEQVGTVRAEVSGVPAGQPRLLKDVPAVGPILRRQSYEWDLDLPEQDRHLVTVFAAHAAPEGPTDVEQVRIRAEGKRMRTREPKLYVVASGVNEYLKVDPDLMNAVQDATSIRDMLASRSLELYDIGSSQALTDVTRDDLKSALSAVVADLEGRVTPDDLLVLFLAGHGIRTTTAEGSTYAYLCHDAELVESDAGELQGRAGVIGWADLAPLSELSCRKLALVDTCYSGALTPASRGTSPREFQENGIIVLAASADDQKSLEGEPKWEGHGVFTKALLDGLSGRADDRTWEFARLGGRQGDGDGIVSLDELIEYVLSSVPGMTRPLVGMVLESGEVVKKPQTPQASPRDLLEFVEPPLTKVSAVSP
jgi:WD40 repeat protein